MYNAILLLGTLDNTENRHMYAIHYLKSMPRKKIVLGGKIIIEICSIREL